MRCADPVAATRMRAEVDDAMARGDTLGGVIEVVAVGLPDRRGQLRAGRPAAAERAGRGRVHGARHQGPGVRPGLRRGGPARQPGARRDRAHGAGTARCGRSGPGRRAGREALPAPRQQRGRHRRRHQHRRAHRAARGHEAHLHAAHAAAQRGHAQRRGRGIALRALGHVRRARRGHRAARRSWPWPWQARCWSGSAAPPWTTCAPPCRPTARASRGDDGGRDPLPDALAGAHRLHGLGQESPGPPGGAAPGLPFSDTDEVIEERHGAIADIFARSGEAAFRQIERDIVVPLLRDAADARRAWCRWAGARC